jgi:hypothetical protein
MSEVKEEIIIEYHVDGEVFETQDKAIDYCYEQEIIYYYKATEYLLENDSSLRDSLDLAHDMGFSLENLNSEVLATLLYQRDLLESIEEVIKENK